MKLLSDRELHYKIINEKLVSEGFRESDKSCWTAKESAIQPCSLDLHIGEIFVPKGDDGVLSEYSLKPGETVVIRTREVLNLSNKIAAIGFPPSSMSRKGILTTNPGHVDPGYKGVFHITLINMGMKEYPLEAGKLIVTLLFFELDVDVEKGLVDRISDLSENEVPSELQYLASDFMDFESRAEDIAEKAVERAETGLKRIRLWGSILIPVLVALLTGFFGYLNIVKSGRIEALENIDAEKRLTKIEGSIDEYEYRERIANIEKQLKSLNDKIGSVDTDKNNNGTT